MGGATAPATFFGAFQPAAGDAFTATDTGRTTVNRIDSLGQVEGWVNPATERVDAVADHLDSHNALDVLLVNLAHPRWEFVCQPVSPGGRCCAPRRRKGGASTAWAEKENAVESATLR